MNRWAKGGSVVWGDDGEAAVSRATLGLAGYVPEV